jgi:hypothetical protein
MKHGGHLNPGTHGKYYQPNNPGTDGQNAYLGGKLRTLVADLFRSITVPHNPHLWQTLPAEKKYEMERSPEFVALDGQLRDVNAETPSEERERRRRKVYAGKHKLMSSLLREAQEGQECKPPSTATEEIQSIGGHRARFARFSRLTPERLRLAKSMFVVGWLRSVEGRSVLQDMIALYQQKTEVAFRPGLEPENCHCPGAHRGGKPDKYAIPDFHPLLQRSLFPCMKRKADARGALSPFQGLGCAEMEAYLYVPQEIPCQRMRLSRAVFPL